MKEMADIATAPYVLTPKALGESGPKGLESRERQLEGRKDRGKWMDRGNERGKREAKEEAAWLVSEGSNCAINYRDELSPSTPLQAPRLS